MERAIRIGKDFKVRWSINKVVDGERQPYELVGKDLMLQFRTPYGMKETAHEWVAEGNIIIWTFRGKDQKAIGSYELILTENDGKDGMVTVDTCKAFRLVAHSCEETQGSGGDIVIDDLVLESEVAFAALRGPQGERGPEGPQGEPGPAYDDTELKKDINMKLSGKVDKVPGKGLSTYDFNSLWQNKIERGDNEPLWVGWEELRDLRDAGELIAGRLYRIIDYVTTTTQGNTRSAEHRFDLIVLALSENTLSEEAYAIYSDEDSYFADNGANLSAWKIWYCLDNDRERFAWADEENGKGVIYRMIDEWGNDCPYDFKNIQFKRNMNFDEGYAEYSDDGDETWVYTFAGQSYHINNDEYSEMLDGSLESPFGHMSDEGGHTFHDNIIKPYIKVYDEVDELRENCGLRYLNNIVFFGYWEEIGSSDDEYTYYYAYCCWNNRMGYGCYNNSFGNICYNNSFGNGCYNNSFGNSCESNSFGNGCYNNSFGNSCESNSFGSNCHYNTFGNNCSYNSFGNNCSYNSFGNSCESNSFGNGCNRNSFTDDGDGSSQYIKGLAHNVTNCLYDDGVHDVTMYYDDISDAYESINNIHIYRGVHDVSYTPTADIEVEQSFCCNHQGEIVPFILIDIITKVNDL